MNIIIAAIIIGGCLIYCSNIISDSLDKINKTLDYIDGRLAGCQYALQSLATNFHKE